MPPLSQRFSWSSVALALAVAVVAFVAVVAAAYAADTGGEPRTIRRLSVAGVEAGNRGLAEFEAALDQVQADVERRQVRIDLPDGPRFFEAGDIGISIDRDGAIRRAFEVGREGSFATRFRHWLASFTTGRQFDVNLTFDADAADAAVAGLDGLVVAAPVEPRLVMSSEQALTIRRGSEGERVDTSAIVERLAIQTAAGGPFDVDAPTRSVPTETSDEEVVAEAERLNDLTAGGIAVRVGDTERTIPEPSLRVRLDIAAGSDGPRAEFDLASLQRVLEHTFGDLRQGGTDPVFDVVDGEVEVIEEGELPLECCHPDAAAVIAEAVFADQPGPVEVEPRPSADPRYERWAEGAGVVELVSEFTTSHSCCQGRVDNIQRFADIVRGAYLIPGESLSLNEHVGQRTTEKGFVPAGTIIQGHLVSSVGGGVSQFATTMFNAAFFAGFDFETYQSHSIYFSRYPYGREATISWPLPDLEFTNTTDYPALIWTSYDSTSITVQIFSTKSVEVEQVRQETSPARQCTRVDTYRLRTYDDGRQVEDSVFATYRPAEGLDCNGNPTDHPDE